MQRTASEPPDVMSQSVECTLFERTGRPCRKTNNKISIFSADVALAPCSLALSLTLSLAALSGCVAGSNVRGPWPGEQQRG